MVAPIGRERRRLKHVHSFRPPQPDRRYDEAELWRRRACQAGEYLALQAAITGIEQRGGDAEEIEQLLRGPAEAGDIWSMKELADRLDQASRGAAADQWLKAMADEGNL